MTRVRDLVIDLDDLDVAILKTLTARLARPSSPDEEARWPSRVVSFWYLLCAGLDEELCRRVRLLAQLEEMAEEDGTGALVAEDDEDLSGWCDSSGDVA